MEQPLEQFNLPKLEPRIRDFLTSLKSFEFLVSKFDFKIQTYSERSLLEFLRLPSDIQDRIIQGFTSYLNFLIECVSSGQNLRNDRELLKTFLKKFGFVYDETILDQINDGDVIEIYTKEQIQIFRNLVFMDLCNYTLLDLLAYDPYELYERSEKVKQLLQESVIALATRPYSLSSYGMSHVPLHVLREKFSDQKLSSLVEFRFIAPLYNWPPREMAAFIAVQQGRNVTDVPNLESLSFL